MVTFRDIKALAKSLQRGFSQSAVDTLARAVDEYAEVAGAGFVAPNEMDVVGKADLCTLKAPARCDYVAPSKDVRLCGGVCIDKHGGIHALNPPKECPYRQRVELVGAGGDGKADEESGAILGITAGTGSNEHGNHVNVRIGRRHQPMRGTKVKIIPVE